MLNPKEDYDYYYVDIGTGLLEAIVQVSNTVVNIEISIYDSTYQRKTWGVAGEGDPEHLVLANLPAGRYYLLVKHCNWTGTPPYNCDLQVFASPPPTPTPTPTVTRPLH